MKFGHYMSEFLYNPRDDLIRGFGMTENNPYGLQKRFSGFMDNMTERGPYLTNPKEIKRYHKTLVD